MQYTLAQLDGILDLIVESLVRDILSQNENAHGAGKQPVGVLESNNAEDTPRQN